MGGLTPGGAIPIGIPGGAPPGLIPGGGICMPGGIPMPGIPGGIPGIPGIMPGGIMPGGIPPMAPGGGGGGNIPGGGPLAIPGAIVLARQYIIEHIRITGGRNPAGGPAGGAEGMVGVGGGGITTGLGIPGALFGLLAAKILSAIEPWRSVLESFLNA